MTSDGLADITSRRRSGPRAIGQDQDAVTGCRTVRQLEHNRDLAPPEQRAPRAQHDRMYKEHHPVHQTVGSRDRTSRPLPITTRFCSARDRSRAIYPMTSPVTNSELGQAVRTAGRTTRGSWWRRLAHPGTGHPRRSSAPACLRSWSGRAARRTTIPTPGSWRRRWPGRPRSSPSPVPETVPALLTGASGRLHDPVEAEMVDHHDAHPCPSYGCRDGASPEPGSAVPSPIGVVITLVVGGVMSLFHAAPSHNDKNAPSSRNESTVAGR